MSKIPRHINHDFAAALELIGKPQAENARLLELLVEVRSAIKDQTCCGVSYCDLVITDDLANRIDAATKRRTR